MRKSQYRATTARYNALQWFCDHERDPTSVLVRRRPSTKIRRLMLQERQLYTVPVGQFGYDHFLLTKEGRQLLSDKGKRLKA